ncbi:polysaccharide biosynthesis protein [Anaerosalibacter massiliensis]|uniref:Polysaccharide biosynthesis protein n=1 Tax=Anaerosalibacter massiliensis TaxID=1347392 RepID=A0A9X2MKN9_9FIRM|nr:nucleoside-diphosphate sugar epimerase/dehydratase [Anaerosalibacter massiliensis]MCR2045364.1 polysaccharide biosynthesis protein [Anaerosalibacter massiliensis]
MKKKNFILIILDIVLINLAYILALYLRFDGNIPQLFMETYINNVIAISLIKIIVFYFFKLYKSIWKYASIDEMIDIVLASIVANALAMAYMTLTQVNMPRSIYLMAPILDMAFIGGIRFSYRALSRVKNGTPKNLVGCKRILIVGAGSAGAMIIKELRNHRTLRSIPVAILDDDLKKKDQNINGVPILGNRKDIPRICKEENIDEIIIAIPSANKKEIREIVNETRKTKCKTKIVPGMYELIDGQVSIKEIRDVEIEDLLGREEINLDMDEICGYIKNRRILVTGGGGSIGSELCRQIARFNPEELIILDIYENNAYDIQNELLRKYDDLNLKVIIASVRDKKRIDEIIEKEKPDVVFHAAAHKHVPLMENNPEEAIKNNVFGTLNLVQASDKYNVKKFVLISTDKAVNPTNIMGATKRICEKIIQSKNEESNTEFVAVRFGNVLGSNGSVIPLFKRQIAEGGPVTVTHEEVIRYFMTIPEACQLVLQAGSMAEGGEIFILDMGEPVKIIDLAKDLIRLSGFEPNVDIPIEITGLRPGEKLFEELLLDEEGISDTSHNKIFIGKPIFTDYNYLLKELEKLKDVTSTGDIRKIKQSIQNLVPTYKVYKQLDSSKKENKDSRKSINKIPTTSSLY